LKYGPNSDYARPDALARLLNSLAPQSAGSQRTGLAYEILLAENGMPATSIMARDGCRPLATSARPRPAKAESRTWPPQAKAKHNRMSDDDLVVDARRTI